MNIYNKETGKYEITFLNGTKKEFDSLIGANLEGANLECANLRFANLEGANLEGANLRDVNLRNANLEGANLRNVNLEGTNLRGANLEGTKGISIIESEELSYKIIKTETHFFIGCQKISAEEMEKLAKDIFILCGKE